MASYHNNQLNVVGLFDSETNNSPGPSSGILASALSGFSGATDAGNGYLHGYGHAALVNYGFGSRPVEPERFIAGPIGNQGQEHEDEARFKTEDNMSPVSYAPSNDSDYCESAGEDVSPRKAPTLNKDGVPRKPRQPRPKLLKWTDNDWKNVVLGIIWACGEQGVQIPFSQAAELVGENCTASALQQAVLKLRCKQIAEGHHIPVLKMAWTRKNRNKRSSTPIANTKRAQVQFKSPTWKRVLEKFKRSLVVKLKIGRHGMDTKNEQPEAHVLPVNSMQPETSMLSMNGINGIHAGAHMLTTNNTQAEVHMLPTDNMQAGSYMPSTNNMLPANNTHAGGLALPVNNLFSGTPSPAPWAQSYHHLYQGHLQGTQLSQSLSPDQKRYNRNHVVAGNGMFDEDDYLIATVEELRPLESIFTPGTDLFRGQYLYTEPLNDLHSQAQGLLDLPNDMDFSSFTNDESPLVNHDNQDYVFKTES